MGYYGDRATSAPRLNRSNMAITVNHSVQGNFPAGSTTLADLKELVEAAEKAGLPATARVTIDYFRGDQREPSYATLTVRGR